MYSQKAAGSRRQYITHTVKSGVGNFLLWSKSSGIQ
jgi:hypothetical protein